jgi:hypothetical protein
MNANTKTFPSHEEADRLAKESWLRQMSGNPDGSLVVAHEGLTDSNLPALQRDHQAAFTAERTAFELNGRLSGPKGQIRRRDDLSFTRRDAQDRLINWHVDPAQRAVYWENGKAIGKVWFEEVRKLAKHNPKKAFDALRFGCCDMSRSGYGEEAGFMEAFAQAAIAGILAHPEGIPEITT